MSENPNSFSHNKAHLFRYMYVVFGLVMTLFCVVTVAGNSLTSEIHIETTTPSQLSTGTTDTRESDVGEAICTWNDGCFYVGIYTNLHKFCFNTFSCNTTVLNSNTKLHLRRSHYRVRINCDSYHGDSNSFLPSSLHADLFEDSKIPLIIEIYGCFITSISKNVFRKHVSALSIYGGFQNQHDSICNQEKMSNKLEQTICANDYLLFPAGIFKGLKLKDLELGGVRLNDSIWRELREIPIGFLNFSNNNIKMIEREALNRLANLKFLDLHNNLIQELKTGTFAALNRLKGLDLSNNIISYIEKDAFKGLTSLRYLNLTSNRIGTIRNTFIFLVQLKELYVSDNLIKTIEKDMFDGLERLEKLDLRSNRMKIIDIKHFQATTDLKYLDIRNNPLSFKSLPVHVFIASSKPFTVNMSKHHWRCDCESLVKIKQFMYENITYTSYFSNLTCEYIGSSTNQSMNYKVSDVYMPNICQNNSGSVVKVVHTILQNHTYIVNDTIGKTKEIYKTEAVLVVIVILSVVLIGLLTFGVIFKYRKFLKIWCFIKFGWKFHRNDDNEDANRPYDAFVSYNSNDVHIVVRELLPRLEQPKNGRQGYKLCIHHRDFPLGGVIAESIIDAVNKSKRVIMLLSNNFLRSEWCQYEFQKAHYQLLKERKNRIIMILLEEISHELLYKEMGLYLKTRTYVTYDDPWLWPKIEYAMPESRPINEANLIENGAIDAQGLNQLDRQMIEANPNETDGADGVELIQLDD